MSAQIARIDVRRQSVPGTYISGATCAVPRSTSPSSRTARPISISAPARRGRPVASRNGSTSSAAVMRAALRLRRLRPRRDDDGRQARARADAEHVVDDARKVLDVDESAGKQTAREPHRSDLGGKLLVPVVRELGQAMPFATGAVADDDPGEADVRMLGTPHVDELLQRGLADDVGAETWPGRSVVRAH